MQETEFALFRIAELIYAVSFFGYLCGAIFQKARIVSGAVGLAILGFFAHTAFLIVRWIAQGHPPIVNLFELVCSGGWFAILILFVVYFFYRKASTGSVWSVVLPLVFLTMGATFFINPKLSSMSPALNSYWLYIHVFFALVSYGCFMIAAGGGVIYLVKARRIISAGNGSDTLDKLNHRLILIGFITTATFIAAGAVWAHYAWGRYWGWDPVETASLATWLVYGLYLHLWLKRGWRGKKTSWFAIIAFATVLLSFWLIPFLDITVHIYEGM